MWLTSAKVVPFLDKLVDELFSYQEGIMQPMVRMCHVGSHHLSMYSGHKDKGISIFPLFILIGVLDFFFQD